MCKKRFHSESFNPQKKVKKKKTWSARQHRRLTHPGSNQTFKIKACRLKVAHHFRCALSAVTQNKQAQNSLRVIKLSHHGPKESALKLKIGPSGSNQTQPVTCENPLLCLMTSHSRPEGFFFFFPMTHLGLVSPIPPICLTNETPSPQFPMAPAALNHLSCYSFLLETQWVELDSSSERGGVVSCSPMGGFIDMYS